MEKGDNTEKGSSSGGGKCSSFLENILVFLYVGAWVLVLIPLVLLFPMDIGVTAGVTLLGVLKGNPSTTWDNVVQINEGMRTALVAGAPFLVLSFLGVFLLRRLMGWLYGVAMIAELEGLIKRMGKGYASLMAIAVAGIIAQRVITEVIISP